MKKNNFLFIKLIKIFIMLLVWTNSTVVFAQMEKVISSYGPTNQTETFDQIKASRMAVKSERSKLQKELLDSRYNLSTKTATETVMSGGKPLPIGPTAKLKGTSWNELDKMTPKQIKEKGLFPYKPLPFADHAEGGMLFPEMISKLLPRLVRFDLDFDLPEQILPDPAPAIFLTTRPDLGDVAKGRLITIDNYYEIFNGLLNPKQLEGLRLLVTQFPQQQFNATEDRRTDRPSLGVTCFDCHANGHTNGANHLVGDIRPQEFRHRIETPTLRGVNIQRLFGSQRALKTVEDFTEFEQRAAYFDGDHCMAAKKGVNVLERGSQVHFMAEFLAILDFPPASKLDIYGELDKAEATPSELSGEALFNGKARCSTCHPAPYYTDNSMHDLKAERFYKKEMANGMMMAHDGTIKTFPLRGIKDSPPYMHDGRCFTLEDTVEYFNLIQQLHLNDVEKADLVAFLRSL
ncbi:MAG: cytochrome B6 [Proteobacteria bacterium]|nr:cytochrome B6 [Desulfocapsa sp.]MBU3945942.1 cytochrome B6 [Pseudomonadota bacterium]MCG2744997.1 cytochrome B6 [Desulfobacteraceae bacterium]MBU3984026.1 cytochrome B6 [Pseudomonadota bacterium]MBU4027506.1 cytochrome B6 [Pseudomonadota bacterium]